MYTNDVVVEIKGEIRIFGDFFRPEIAGAPTVLK
jgi:hypothetical protein